MEESPGNSDSSEYMGDKSRESNEFSTEDLRSIDSPQRNAGSTPSSRCDSIKEANGRKCQF